MTEKASGKSKKTMMAPTSNNKSARDSNKETNVNSVMVPVYTCSLCASVYTERKAVKSHVGGEHNIAPDRIKQYIQKEMRKAVITVEPTESTPPPCAKCLSDAVELDELHRIAQEAKEKFLSVSNSVDKFMSEIT